MNRRVYEIWKSMRQRCENLRAKDYANYGGRGIRVCERWNSFDVFADDMGPRPDGYSIERLNNDGDYEPGNCRWASRVEQNNNRRNNHIVDLHGERMTITQAIRVTGSTVTSSTVSARLRSGWDLSRALSLPPMAQSEVKRRYPNRGKTHCKRGHEFTESNTRIIPHYKTGKPLRICRACSSIRRKESRALAADQQIGWME